MATWFNALPLELQLHIANAVGERCDRAALALASPSLLAACRKLTSYQGLEMSLAFDLVLGGAIDEQLLRSYVRHSEATPEGCEWLAGLAAAAGQQIRVVHVPVHIHVHGVRLQVHEEWYLMQPDKPGMKYHYEGGTMRYHATGPMQPGTNGAKLRAGRPQAHGRGTCHYEGEEGAEHKVYFTTSSGDVVHYKGKKSEEYMVCLKMLYGGLLHYKGECGGAERPARYELPYGGVIHFETDADRVMRIYDWGRWRQWRRKRGRAR